MHELAARIHAIDERLVDPAGRDQARLDRRRRLAARLAAIDPSWADLHPQAVHCRDIDLTARLFAARTLGRQARADEGLVGVVEDVEAETDLLWGLTLVDAETKLLLLALHRYADADLAVEAAGLSENGARSSMGWLRSCRLLDADARVRWDGVERHTGGPRVEHSWM